MKSRPESLLCKAVTTHSPILNEQLRTQQGVGLVCKEKKRRSFVLLQREKLIVGIRLRLTQLISANINEGKEVIHREEL